MKEKAKLTVEEIENLLTAEFPQMFNPQGGFAIDDVWFRGCRVRKRYDPQSLRPGGTIAGRRPWRSPILLLTSPSTPVLVGRQWR